MKFFLNKNPQGKVTNLVFGLAEIIDGLIRLFSLGFVATTAPLDVSRQAAKRFGKQMREKQAASTK